VALARASDSSAAEQGAIVDAIQHGRAYFERARLNVEANPLIPVGPILVVGVVGADLKRRGRTDVELDARTGFPPEVLAFVAAR